MTFTDPTPPTADDNSPAARLAQTRQDYRDAVNRVDQLTTERVRLAADNKKANEDYRKRMTEISVELQAARTLKAGWAAQLPRGDTARGNGS